MRKMVAALAVVVVVMGAGLGAPAASAESRPSPWLRAHGTVNFWNGAYMYWGIEDGFAASLRTQPAPRAPLVGRTILFLAGDVEICRAVTNTMGDARCTADLSKLPARMPSVPWRAVFLGDDDWRPAYDYYRGVSQNPPY